MASSQWNNPNMEKPSSDKGSYRLGVLPNGLEALLISQPSASQVAAALNITVGDLNNSRENPAIAHACEHGIFSGSKKVWDISLHEVRKSAKITSSTLRGMDLQITSQLTLVTTMDVSGIHRQSYPSVSLRLFLSMKGGLPFMGHWTDSLNSSSTLYSILRHLMQ